MNIIRPGGTIGVLGGGQLGRMLAMEGRRMGYRVGVMDPVENCPAGLRRPLWVKEFRLMSSPLKLNWCPGRFWPTSRVARPLVHHRVFLLSSRIDWFNGNFFTIITCRKPGLSRFGIRPA